MSVSSEQASQEPWGWESPAGTQPAVPQRGYTKEQVHEVVAVQIAAAEHRALASVYSCIGLFFAGILLGFMALYHASKARKLGRKVGWAVYVLAAADAIIGALQAYYFFNVAMSWWVSTH